MTRGTERHLLWYIVPHSVTSNPHADDGPYRSGNRDAEVEVYEDDGNVVIFDAANPLAWVEASRTIRLTDAT
ncbi:hypothetical protein JCM18237_22700 [Halorubrum luteum]